MADGGNQGPFGEKNFFIPNLHWPYGLSRPGTTGSSPVAAAAHQCILVPDWVRRRMLRRSTEGATRVTLDEIKALGLRLAELCQKYGIAELSVFGSVARGDSRPDSDVDLLYVRVPGNDLGMSYFALQDDLEKLFGRPVDLVPKEGLHRVIREQVLADAQVLYAA
jgi:predicted nucleotidyltransferase